MTASALRKIPLPGDSMLDNAAVLEHLLLALAAAQSPYVIIGGLAAGYHGRVRATIDVDLLVPRAKMKKLAAEMTRLGYDVTEHKDMVRCFTRPSRGADASESVADLVALESNATLRAAAKEVEQATLLGQSVPIVRRGAFVALKYHAAVSPTRRIEDRYQDLVDIGRVLHKRFDSDDRALALRIAQTMYPGASAELAKALEDLAAGRPVAL